MEQKDVHTSSPVRTPKLQLPAEQPSTGECWIPTKDTPRPRAKEKPQEDGRRGEIAFRIKTHTHTRRAQTNLVHTTTQRPQRLSQNCV